MLCDRSTWLPLTIDTYDIRVLVTNKPQPLGTYYCTYWWQISDLIWSICNLWDYHTYQVVLIHVGPKCNLCLPSSSAGAWIQWQADRMIHYQHSTLVYATCMIWVIENKGHINDRSCCIVSWSTNRVSTCVKTSDANQTCITCMNSFHAHRERAGNPRWSICDGSHFIWLWTQPSQDMQ